MNQEDILVISWATIGFIISVCTVYQIFKDTSREIDFLDIMLAGLLTIGIMLIWPVLIPVVIIGSFVYGVCALVSGCVEFIKAIKWMCNTPANRLDAPNANRKGYSGQKYHD